MWEQLVQLLFSGLTLGSIYALMALSLVTTLNITGVVNLAQGEFAALGALLAISMTAEGMPIALSFAASVILVGILGGLLERVSIHPARGASGLTLILITIGLSISLRGMALLIWGTDTYSLPAFSKGGPLSIGGAAVNLQSLWVLGLVAAAVSALYFFLNRTYTGKAVKASVINRTAARLVGISVGTISFWAFAGSGALGAAAGIFIAPITMTTYDMGFMLGIKGFVAASIGGLNSVAGAVLGGLLLGVLEAYGAGLISSGLKDAFSIIVLLGILLFRPEGILGRLGERKI